MFTPTRASADLKDFSFPTNMRIAGVSDTHHEQVCGVTKSIAEITEVLGETKNDLLFIQTGSRRSDSLSIGRSGVRVTWNPLFLKQVVQDLEHFGPDNAHVFTEGPIGLSAKNYFNKNGLKHTSSFHTDWPSYVVTFAKRYVNFNESAAMDLLWRVFERFHASSELVMTRSKTFVDLLRSRGFKNVVEWNGGVDLEKFKAEGPIDERMLQFRSAQSKPIVLYVGRISDEKNIKAFLDSKVDALKVLVGPITPYAEELRVQYPTKENVVFLGKVDHHKLGQVFRGADLMVFPSRTDTFGLVNIEALACGIPVVGFESTCLRDIVEHQVTGILTSKEAHLAEAINDGLKLAKLEKTKSACVNRAADFSILKTTHQFVSNLVGVR